MDEVAHVGAEGDAIAKVVVAVNELVEDGAEGLIAGLNDVQRKRLELAGTAGDRTLRIADSRYLDFAPSRSCSGTKFGETKQAVGLEMIEESAVLLLLQLAGGTFPLEEFAKSSASSVRLRLEKSRSVLRIGY